MFIYKLKPGESTFSFSKPYEKLFLKFGPPGSSLRRKWDWHYTVTGDSLDNLNVSIWFKNEEDEMVARLMI